MIVGDLLLVMAGDPYQGPPMARATLNALFSVEVSNKVGGSVSLDVVVQHRNREDTSWGTAGTFAPITADGPYHLKVTGLKELIRYTFAFSAGSASDGMVVFAAPPQPLND